MCAKTQKVVKSQTMLSNLLISIMNIVAVYRQMPRGERCCWLTCRATGQLMYSFTASKLCLHNIDNLQIKTLFRILMKIALEWCINYYHPSIFPHATVHSVRHFVSEFKNYSNYFCQFFKQEG